MQPCIVQTKQDIARNEQPGNRPHLGSQRDVCLVDGGGKRADIRVGIADEIRKGRVLDTGLIQQRGSDEITGETDPPA